MAGGGLNPGNWDDLGYDDEFFAGDEDPEPDPLDDDFAPDGLAREVALVALGAAALARRAFPGQYQEPGPLSSQLLLALALLTPTEPHGIRWGGMTVPGLANLLAARVEEVEQGLRLLKRSGLAARDYEKAWTLTDQGRQQAIEQARFAAKFIGRWPPRRSERPRRSPD